MNLSKIARSPLGSLVAIAVLLNGTSCGRLKTPELPAEDRLLDKLMEIYVAERFRFYPVEATLAGLPGNDDRLGDYARSDIQLRIGWLSDFHQKLVGLRLTALSQPAYLDALWLRSLVKDELLVLEERGLWRKTMSFYSEKARVGLVALLVDPNLAERANALAGRLSEIPELFARARENVGVASSVWWDDGLGSLEQCRQLLADMPEILKDRVAPHRLAELALLSRAATRALQDTVSFGSRSEHSGDSDDYRLGYEGLERFLLYRDMVDWPIEELEERVEADHLAVYHRVTELALSQVPVLPLRDLLSHGKGAFDPLSLVESVESDVRTFTKKSSEADAPESPIPVVEVPYYFVAPYRVRLWRPAALEPNRPAFLMVSRGLEVELSKNEVELLAFLEVSGRSHVFERQSGSPSLLRRVFASGSMSEGFRLKRGLDLLELGFGAENAALTLEERHGALLELTRLLAVVRLHARGESLSEIEGLFYERGYVSRRRAKLEAARVATDPGAGRAALGLMLLDELSRLYWREHPLATAAELDERILSGGLLPVRLVRFHLLGGGVPPGSTPGL
jgi:hypothetical protein